MGFVQVVNDEFLYSRHQSTNKCIELVSRNIESISGLGTKLCLPKHEPGRTSSNLCFFVSPVLERRLQKRPLYMQL